MPRNDNKGSRALVAVPAVYDAAPLTVDGVEYRLVYNYRAIAEAEQIVNQGRGFLEQVNLLLGLIGLIGAANLAGLFWAGLRMHHPKVTFDEATSLIRPDTVNEITTAVRRSYELAQPEASRKDPTQASASE